MSVPATSPPVLKMPTGLPTMSVAPRSQPMPAQPVQTTQLPNPSPAMSPHAISSPLTMPLMNAKVQQLRAESPQRKGESPPPESLLQVKDTISRLDDTTRTTIMETLYRLSKTAEGTPSPEDGRDIYKLLQ
jgi:hypothetical protein